VVGAFSTTAETFSLTVLPNGKGSWYPVSVGLRGSVTSGVVLVVLLDTGAFPSGIVPSGKRSSCSPGFFLESSSVSSPISPVSRVTSFISSLVASFVGVAMSALILSSSSVNSLLASLSDFCCSNNVL